MRDELRGRWNLIGNLRLVAFLVTAVLVLAGLQLGETWLFAVAAVAAVAFVALIAHHRRLGKQWRRADALYAINHESILRGERNWTELPLRNDFRPDPGHPFAGDLDLYGHASLFHLLETVETPIGAGRLRDWLVNPAPPELVRERQQGVVELAPAIEWRQELAVRGRLLGEERPNPEPLLSWAEGDRWLESRRALRLVAMLTPVTVIATAVLAGFGLLPWIVPIAVAVLNIVLTQVVATEARSRIGLVAEQFPSISQYAELLAQVEVIPGNSVAIHSLRDRVKTEGRDASDLLGDLGGRAAFAVPPGTLLYLPLQAIFAWDINVLARLEAWQATAGSHVRDWLAAIGDAEALSALATLAYDEPTWTMPSVDASNDTMSAAGLGHPLLRDDVRVVNDIEIGPPGSFLLVTGSNMSGKSTLLRAIGVNLVLAGAGGPVCATRLSAPPVRLWTSVRVEDSLERGVSFFMAELQRLKQVVDAATEADQTRGRIFYLLDEILQGTNTAERQIAARRVIRHLVDEGAIGAVSTHDLTLAEGPELETVAHPVHLRDTVTATGMSFDYKLRPGVATSTNALRLMDIVFGKTS
ncbi:MAG: DNA mismatch repair protein MutS [Thermomicrobiales bacterium]|nr:DNA mismatch repair protein MutS [Thermomicrobiales bacterium]